MASASTQRRSWLSVGGSPPEETICARKSSFAEVARAGDTSNDATCPRDLVAVWDPSFDTISVTRPSKVAAVGRQLWG